jgi:hypothetical protein
MEGRKAGKGKAEKKNRNIIKKSEPVKIIYGIKKKKK